MENMKHMIWFVNNVLNFFDVLDSTLCILTILTNLFFTVPRGWCITIRPKHSQGDTEDPIICSSSQNKLQITKEVTVLMQNWTQSMPVSRLAAAWHTFNVVIEF